MKRRPLPLNALRSFEAAARLGRMIAAADELAVTHSAISRQIQHLETVLGVALFDGPRTKPRLTPAGQALLPALSSAFDQIDLAVRAASRIEDDVLDVSCLSTFLMRWLIPRLHRFNTLHPDIDVRLRATEFSTSPRSDRFDVAIEVDDGSPQVGDRPDSHLLFRESLGPVMAPGMDVTSVAALDRKPLLQTRTRMNAWAMWCTAAGVTAIDPKGTVFEHYYYTLEAASSGLGICIAPWHLVMDDIEAKRLTAPLGFAPSNYRYVARPRLGAARKVDRFCTWLVDEARGMPVPVPSTAGA